MGMKIFRVVVVAVFVAAIFSGCGVEHSTFRPASGDTVFLSDTAGMYPEVSSEKLLRDGRHICDDAKHNRGRYLAATAQSVPYFNELAAFAFSDLCPEV